MHVFFAFDLDDALLDGASALVDALRDRVPARWCARETLHVTARFIGTVEDAQIASLAELTPRLARDRASPVLRATRVGGFPDARNARILFAAVEDDGTMVAVARAAEAAVTALGHPPEERAYIPHLTLARTKVPVDLHALAAVPVALEGRAVALTLYRSQGIAGPSKYEPLASCRLT